MEIEQKKALLDASLERAAEQVGDITPPVMELFYSRYPQARQRFEELCAGNLAQLEGEMVEQAVYCLMTLLDSPGEVEFILWNSVPHHSDTLHVPPEWYTGLIDATFDIIASTIPADETAELAVCDELRSQMRAFVSLGASDAPVKPPGENLSL